MRKNESALINRVVWRSHTKLLYIARGYSSPPETLRIHVPIRRIHGPIHQFPHRRLVKIVLPEVSDPPFEVRVALFHALKHEKERG